MNSEKETQCTGSDTTCTNYRINPVRVKKGKLNATSEDCDHEAHLSGGSRQKRQRRRSKSIYEGVWSGGLELARTRTAQAFAVLLVLLLTIPL